MHEKLWELNRLEHFFRNRWLSEQTVGVYILVLLFLSLLIYYQWIIGLISTFIAIIVLIDSRRRELLHQRKQIKFITEISYRVESAGKDVFSNVPIGIIIYNEAFEIEWANAYIYQLNDSNSLLTKSLTVFSEKVIPYIRGEEAEISVKINESDFKMSINRENRTLYLLNHTDEVQLREQIKNDQLVVANIFLDNYEEISGGLQDDVKGQINASITSQLNKWAEENELLLKRVSQDRYFTFFTKRSLDKIEKTKFHILDEMRQLHMEETQRNPITLSIGIGEGADSIPELAELAQSALDVALGRGGDQVTIRDAEGRVRFYGGKTNPMEKRTRVRARVVSHALKELVKDSDNVIIMGHKSPDMDSLGSAIGVLNIAQSNNVKGYIIFDEEDVTTGVNRVTKYIKQNEELWSHFVSPDEADALYTPKSLVILVDTHKPSLAANEKLLMKATYKVVIDHHRRSEEFIENPALIYMEPYASSTAELVTELIEYQPRRKRLSTLEATALLAGIIVDTKSFAFRTGARTFDAASYLRLKGADPILVQEFLKDDLSTHIKRNKLIERCYMFRDNIAIVCADDEEEYNHIIIAQAADTLLTINNIQASFVIGKSNAETIFVSARSQGKFNVQLIMEAMYGGGHLTNAATQIQDMSLLEVEQMLHEKITIYLEEEEV